MEGLALRQTTRCIVDTLQLSVELTEGQDGEIEVRVLSKGKLAIVPSAANACRLRAVKS